MIYYLEIEIIRNRKSQKQFYFSSNYSLIFKQIMPKPIYNHRWHAKMMVSPTDNKKSMVLYIASSVFYLIALLLADQMEIEIGDWRKKGWAEEGRWICALIGKVGNAGTDRAGTGKCRNKSKPASNFYTRTHHSRGTKHQKISTKRKKNPCSG